MFTRLLAVVAVMVALSPPAFAMDAAQAAIQADRIDQAGRQRMLIQRIVKAACFVMADVDATRQAEQAVQDVGLFSDTLTALIDGAPDQDWRPEDDDDTLRALRQTRALWQTLQPAALQIAHSDLNPVAVAQVISDTAAAVEAMNNAVAELATAHASGNVDPRAGHTLNIAGRQRMLSQKMAQEYCFLFAGIAQDQYRRRLKESMTAFETSLDSLQQANDTTEDLVPAPNAAAREHLSHADAIWSDLRPILARGVEGRGHSYQDMLDVADLNADLLRASAQAVSAYVTGLNDASLTGANGSK